MIATEDPARVLEFTGKLADDEQAGARYEQLRRHIDTGGRTFVFDLRAVPDVNSSGIGFLVMCLATVERAGGKLLLAAPSERVRYALRITKLNSIFPVIESLEPGVSEPTA